MEEKNWRLDTLRRMDILIEIFCHGEKYALCIENKPFASDQKNQLKDYADELEQRYPNQWQLIYLSGSGKEPSEYSISKEDSELLQSQSKLAVLGYADLIKWLTECILYTKNDRVKVFLEELKLYISQNFITQLSNEEQTVMLKNILDHDDYIKALIEVETLKLQVQENLLVKFKEDLNQLCEGFTLSWHESLNRASVYERTEKICPSLSLITSSLSINHLPYRASRMGANFPSLIPKSSVARKKAHERSEFRAAFDLAFAFSQIHENMNQKLPRRIERKRDSIEFERSENQGQFFMKYAFNYF